MRLIVPILALAALKVVTAQSIANGFDYPVSPPFVTEAVDSDPYYDAQEFGVNRHLGEDWNGNGGGSTDLGDPVFAVANGRIVYAQNAGPGWGNVIIIEHTLPNQAKVRSLYGHLNSIDKSTGDVFKGQQIGTIGRGYDYGGGVYDYTSTAHLHLEIRTDTSIGVGPGYSPNNSGWTDPSDFIDAHRSIQSPPSGTITFSFTGVVTNVNDQNALLTGSVAVGNPVSGTFSYDIDLPADGAPNDSSYGVYAYTSGSSEISITIGTLGGPKTVTTQFGSDAFSNGRITLEVRNNSPLGGAPIGTFYDSFNESGFGAASTWQLPILQLLSLQIGLTDASPPLDFVTTDAIPSELDLLKTQDSYFPTSSGNSSIFGSNLLGPSYYVIGFRLISLTKL